MKVIIIDDEPLARSIVKEYLQSYSDINIVAECNDGFEGMKAILQYEPELIFLDIQMPKINGFEMRFSERMSQSAPTGEITNFVVEQFLLSPLASLLDERTGRYWVAQLTRVAVFWGPTCKGMTALRRARMTPQARADLRTNLSILWARPEQDDLRQLNYEVERPEA